MNVDVMFSSENQQWETRWDTFHSIENQLGRKYNLDPCCENETTKCARYITSAMNVFSYETAPDMEGDDVQFFANPEYGRKPASFVKHFVEWGKEDGVVGDILIPARTDTKLFHEVILPNASTIHFVKGRVVFGEDWYWEWLWQQEYVYDAKGKSKKNPMYQKYGKFNSAPFPSMIVSVGEDKPISYETIVLDKARYRGDLK